MGSPFKRGYGSFMFNADKPHFFKIILQETIADGKLGIPKKFVRLYGKGLSNKVLLEVPNGTVSEVELFKSDGKIWLQNGWKEFAEHYSLALGSLLVFEYKNRCHFHVLIMDKTAMEIDYSFSMTDGDEEPDLEGEFQQPKTEETDDDVSVEILDDFPSYHKTNEKSSAPCPEPQKRTRTNFASKFERTSKLQIRSESVATKQDNSVGKVNSRYLLRQRETYNGWYFSTGGFNLPATRGNRVLPSQKKRLNGVNRAQSLTADEKAATFERASAALKPESPFFMVAMQPSYVYPGCRLPIPKSFAQKYFKNDHGDAVLCVWDGRTWPVKCFVYPGNGKAKTQISSGWNKFTWDNYLEVGDVCEGNSDR
ncbi:B3 domain-containing transcription factor VRN1 [Populus alba]|uniref:B3 domain-containing transcription factor VRN1 n=1 Tax=Populus alba TaxID=43335 RepID=UPI00158D3133|nr:B3 domain-containing transcription factor VRN1-like [Populus alba]